MCYASLHVGVIKENPSDVNSTCNATAKFTCEATDTNQFLWKVNGSLVKPNKSIDGIPTCTPKVISNASLTPAESNLTFSSTCIPDDEKTAMKLDNIRILCQAFHNNFKPGEVVATVNSTEAILRIQGDL